MNFMRRNLHNADYLFITEVFAAPSWLLCFHAIREANVLRKPDHAPTAR
jgi:hypothetical protein